MSQNVLSTERDAIADVVTTMCAAVDRMDWPLLRTCFHPGARLDLGDFLQGTAEDYLAMLQAPDGQAALVRTMHVVGNMSFDVEGDVAHVETYCTGYHEGRPDHPWCKGVVTIRFRWADRIERRDGRWAIADRTCVFEFGRNESTGEWLSFPPERSGRRDRQDPRYRRAAPAGGARG